MPHKSVTIKKKSSGILRKKNMLAATMNFSFIHYLYHEATTLAQWQRG